VKVVIHGPISARDHLGQMVGYGPDQQVEVDDSDEKAVAWAKGWADTPFGTLVEDVAAKEPAKPEPPKQTTRQTTSVTRAERSGR
jgi:hypothetical protein